MLLGMAGPASGAPASPAPAAIDGTYELVKRVMADGEVIVPPAIGALYDLDHGRGNLNLFMRTKDGKLASESTISRYTLTAHEYCEWIVFTTRNNLDAPGVSNQAPPLANHCAPVRLKSGRIVFAPPGEGVTTSFDNDGFTGAIAGQFVDYWKKIR